MYISKGGSRVEIRIMHSNTAKETAHFILKYDGIVTFTFGAVFSNKNAG